MSEGVEQFKLKMDEMEKRFSALTGQIGSLTKELKTKNQDIRTTKAENHTLKQQIQVVQRDYNVMAEGNPNSNWWHGWYDGDAVRTGKNVMIEVNGRVEITDYRSDRMAELMEDVDGNGVCYYEFDEDKFMWDSEQGLTYNGRSMETKSQRESAMRHEMKAGRLKGHAMGARDPTGRMRFSLPLEARSRAGVAKQQGDLVLDPHDMSGHPGSDDPRGQSFVKAPVDVRDAKFDCRQCKAPFTFPKKQLEFLRKKLGEKFKLPANCKKCKAVGKGRTQVHAVLEGTVAPEKPMPIPQGQRAPDVDMPKAKESKRTTKEDVIAQKLFSEAQPIKFAEARAAPSELAGKTRDEIKALHAALLEQIRTESMFQAEGDRVKAESIQAASPAVSLAPGLSVARVEFEMSRGLSRCVGAAASQWFVTIRHGANECISCPMAYYDHGFTSKKQLRSQFSEFEHGGIELPGYDLILYPKPPAMKALSLAKPKVGELAWCWSADTGKTAFVSKGFIIAADTKVGYTDDSGKQWSGDGLWAGSWETKPGASGAPITNKFGECIGFHVASSGKPNSPAYFIPMTDELIKILQTAPKPLNLKAGSDISLSASGSAFVPAVTLASPSTPPQKV